MHFSCAKEGHVPSSGLCVSYWEFFCCCLTCVFLLINVINVFFFIVFSISHL